MFPSHALADMQKQLENVGLSNAFYYIFKDLGIKWCKELNRLHKIKHMDISNWGRNTVTMAGWGVIKIIQDQPKKKLLIL